MFFFNKVLIPVQSAVNDMFVSALSSFRTTEKYAKLNLLTPFGIVIDALMIIDKNGVPCQLAKYMGPDANQNESEEVKK